MKNALAIALVAGMTTAASAEVITSWVTFGQPGNQVSTPVGTQADNVTGIELTRGPGLNATAANNSFSSSGWTTDQAQDYYSFGFTVDSGFEVNLDTFWVGTRSSGTGPGFLGLYYSGDGFTGLLHTFVQDGTNFNNSIVDLSGLTGLTGTVEFRIAMLNDISANGGTVGAGGTFRVGDHFADGNFTEMRFEGTVIPAPGALALIGLGGLVAGRRRR
ncbi:MAG: PEP-CTERM sorting domain-containing protein [Phycisphaerales bacterium]|nr:PEP-CTERM sorting domain-containing protein [Planctomycetota bacterium]MCH8507315.1 PEP-CTERM sorting domain-containing protein [Phycisphaerales bacterium]